MHRKIRIFCLSLLMTLCCCLPVFAEEFDPDGRGSISVTLTEQYGRQPIVGARLEIYYVATVHLNANGNLAYQFTEAFAQCGVAIDDPGLSARLDAYVTEHSIAATEGMTTNAKGKATCSDLELGLYFVKQTGAVEGFAPCTPFLATVPSKVADAYVYDVNASPKTEVARLTTVTIQKVWNTDESTKIPDSVTVQLLRNGNVVQTAVLNPENQWRVSFAEMPQSDSYQVQEVDIPKGFIPTYVRNGDTFTVTNTASLPQTGQLIWPIPVLAASGMLLLVLGFVLLQKKRDANG